jgi:hypothetical protein
VFECEEEGNKNQLRCHISKSLGLRAKDILYAHETDSNKVNEGHFPDCIVVLIHEHRQILIGIGGTKMIPSPHIPDIIMDLSCGTKTFMGIKAHQGMVDGCLSIYSKCEDILTDAIKQNPGYDILIVGYSLGGGIGQLLTLYLMERLKQKEMRSVLVRCIAFAAPPAVNCSADNRYPNIFSIRNGNDIVPSTSLYSISKLKQQIKAVKNLNISLSEICFVYKHLRKIQSSNRENGISDHHSIEEGPKKLSASPKILSNFLAKMQEKTPAASETVSLHLSRIKDALKCFETADYQGTIELAHPAGQYFELSRKSGSSTKLIKLLGDTQHISRNIIFKTSMRNDHMPWEYDKLFADAEKPNVTLEDFEKTLDIYHGAGILYYPGTLYPNLKKILS